MKPYVGNPEIIATIYQLVKSHNWLTDPNPTVTHHFTGVKSTQNNYADHWSQGPTGYPGMPAAGRGNTYNPHDSYVVPYQTPTPLMDERGRYYHGCIPRSNYNDTLTYSEELSNLRDAYTEQWLKSIDYNIRKDMIWWKSALWENARNDTTPLHRAGSRDSR